MCIRDRICRGIPCHDDYSAYGQKSVIKIANVAGEVMELNFNNAESKDSAFPPICRRKS